jgi:hypothetical protein
MDPPKDGKSWTMWVGKRACGWERDIYQAHPLGYLNL